MRSSALPQKGRRRAVALLRRAQPREFTEHSSRSRRSARRRRASTGGTQGWRAQGCRAAGQLFETKTRAERARLLDQIFVGEEQLAPLTTAFFERARRTTAPRPVTLRDVQRALRDDELFLEFALAEPRSYPLIITRATARVQALAGRADSWQTTERTHCKDPQRTTDKRRSPDTGGGIDRSRTRAAEPPAPDHQPGCRAPLLAVRTTAEGGQPSPAREAPRVVSPVRIGTDGLRATGLRADSPHERRSRSARHPMDQRFHRMDLPAPATCTIGTSSNKAAGIARWTSSQIPETVLPDGPRGTGSVQSRCPRRSHEVHACARPAVATTVSRRPLCGRVE